jgi:hypothetical protein
MPAGAGLNGTMLLTLNLSRLLAGTAALLGNRFYVAAPIHAADAAVGIADRDFADD